MPLASSFSTVFITTIRPETFRKEGINFNPLAMLRYNLMYRKLEIGERGICPIAEFIMTDSHFSKRTALFLLPVLNLTIFSILQNGGSRRL